MHALRLRVTTCVILHLVLGCSQSQPSALPPPPRAEPPKARILFQPMFLWEGKKPTRQGTGFLVKTSKGKVAAVTSAHFLDFDGPPLKEVRWLDVGSNKAIASFKTSWGQPGSAGTAGLRKMDLRPDYFIMPATAPQLVLEMDDRPLPIVGESIWFPDKDPDEELGYRLMYGTVAKATESYIEVTLDESLELQSQSGSPILSRATGKVIGTLSRGDVGKGTPSLYLTPAHSIREALADDSSFPALDQVVGKKRRG